MDQEKKNFQSQRGELNKADDAFRVVIFCDVITTINVTPNRTDGKFRTASGALWGRRRLARRPARRPAARVGSRRRWQSRFVRCSRSANQCRAAS